MGWPQSYMQTHPEWTKPTFPYTRGARIQIRAHEPPFPPPPIEVINTDDVEEWEEFSPTDRCLNHPPPEGVEGEGSAVLEIQEPIHAEDNFRAQVVRARVSQHKGSNGTDGAFPPPTDTDFVAKFYDPLYWDHNQTDSDVFKLMDSTYPTEAAVYSKLQKIQGKVIPKFYGSYTCSFPVSKGKQRQVRLILIEYVQGRRMFDLNPQDPNQRQRHSHMKAVIDAETAAFTEDVKLNDVAPRNVLIRSAGNADKEGKQGAAAKETKSDFERVVLIDFDVSELARERPLLIQLRGEDYYMPGVYISPLLRWPKFSGLGEFEDWIDWDWEAWLGEQYAADKAHVTEEMKKVWKYGIA